MKVLLQTGSSGWVPAPPEKRFLINCISFAFLLSITWGATFHSHVDEHHHPVSTHAEGAHHHADFDQPELELFSEAPPCTPCCKSHDPQPVSALLVVNPFSVKTHLFKTHMDGTLIASAWGYPPDLTCYSASVYTSACSVLEPFSTLLQRIVLRI